MWAGVLEGVCPFPEKEQYLEMARVCVFCGAKFNMLVTAKTVKKNHVLNARGRRQKKTNISRHFFRTWPMNTNQLNLVSLAAMCS